jgi:hypothetical protein
MFVNIFIAVLLSKKAGFRRIIAIGKSGMPDANG